MAIQDIFQLMHHYKKTALVVTLSCTLVAAILSFAVPAKYVAQASVTAIDPSNNVSYPNMLAVVNDFVRPDIAPYTLKDSETQASVTLGEPDTPHTLTLTITGTSEEECVRLANSITTNAANKAIETFELLQEANEAGLANLDSLNTSEDVASVLSGTLLQNSLGSGRTFEFCTFMVDEAIAAEETGPGKVEVTLMGLLVGLFFAILVLVLIDKRRAPIKCVDDIQMTTSAPILSYGSPADLGDKVWCNIQLTAKKPIRSVCLIPLGGNSAKRCSDALHDAIEKQGRSAQVMEIQADNILPLPTDPSDITIYLCQPIVSGVGASYSAHDATVTIICACLWADSRKTLCETLNELSLTNANLGGIVALSEEV